MGLFDLFKDEDYEGLMTPHFAFVAALIYMVSADGKTTNEEIGQLLSILGGRQQKHVIGVGSNQREVLNRVTQYAKSTDVDTFLAFATPILTEPQRLCILANIFDVALADGILQPEEKQLLDKFLLAFELPPERIKPIFEALLIKDNRQVFFTQDPLNS
jgi:uncharacterized tellurite resistance protein B-like protein